jgi:hypothetical protein
MPPDPQRRAASSALQQFGYIAQPLPDDREALVAAYEAIHQWRGAAVGRVPDDEEEMTAAIVAALDGRFCGVPEMQNTMQSGAPQGRWERGNLTWSVDKTGVIKGINWVDPSKVNTIETAIWDGLRPWRRAHPSFFDFNQVPAGGDIHFSFAVQGNLSLNGVGSHPRFGTVGGVQGYAEFPDSANRGRVLLDSKEQWTRQLLAQVVEHEIGHVLGLKHSSIAGSTMSPFTANYAPLDANTRNTLLDMYAWTSPKRFDDGRASSDGPALGTTESMSFQHASVMVHIAWKGVEGDSHISISSSEDEGLTWSPQVILDGIRSSHGPALTGFHSAPGSVSPDDVFLAWKGEGEDERLFYSTGFNGNAFASISRLEGHSANARPAVAEFERRVHMVWKAATGDQVLWASWGNGQWSEVTVIPDVLTSHAPALAVFAGQLVLCWQGMGEDERLFQARLGADGTWSAPQLLSFLTANAGAGGSVALVASPILTSHHPSMVATASSLVVAYKGQSGDDAVWLLRGQGIVNGPVQIKDALSSTGPGITAARDKIVCAWKAQAPDQVLHFAIR